MRELILKKCESCEALIKVLTDCHCPCNFNCCDTKMTTLKPNSVDASFEKHVPTYEIKDDYIYVTVNHVMEKEHYIKWLMFVTNNKEYTFYFEPGTSAEAKFPYEKGILYSYCNNHGLWSKEVK